MIEQAFAIGVDVAIKATVLVAFVFAVDRVLAKKVLIRSAIWNACLVALLLWARGWPNSMGHW